MLSRRHVLKWLGGLAASLPFADKLFGSTPTATPVPGPKPATIPSSTSQFGSRFDGLQLAMLHTPHGQLFLGDVSFEYGQDITRQCDEQANFVGYVGGRAHGELTAKVAFSGEGPLKQVLDAPLLWDGELSFRDHVAPERRPHASFALQGVRAIGHGDLFVERDNFIRQGNEEDVYASLQVRDGDLSAVGLTRACGWMVHYLLSLSPDKRAKNLNHLRADCPILWVMVKNRLQVIRDSIGEIAMPSFVAACDNLRFTFTGLGQMPPVGIVVAFSPPVDEPVDEPVLSDHDYMMLRDHYQARGGA